MRILAIDPATRCGWAYVKLAYDNARPSSGTWDLRIRSDESSGMRLLRFEAKIREIDRMHGVHLIVFESATVASGPKANHDATKLHVKLQAIIERLAESMPNLEHKGYNLASIKRHATGKGNASKEQMLVAARAKWGDVADDNEADALWLLDLAQTELALK